MKKPALHWQILVALILAIVIGLIFPTTYELSEKSIEKLEKEHLPAELIKSVTTLQNVEFLTAKEFQEALHELNIEKKHYSLIEQKAYNNDPINYLSWMGDLFLRALKMLVIPLILVSLISGVANLGDSKNLGRLGLKTMGYYLMTSILAILTGLLMVNIIKPGVGADLNFSHMVEGLVEKQKSLREIIIEIVPSNIFNSFNEGDMLSIIFFAILIGFFITKISKDPQKILTDFFNAFFELMMKVTMFVIKFTPYGIFGIVVKVIADTDDLSGLMSRMGIYMFTVIGALFIHAFVILPIILKLFGKVDPRKHFKNVSTPLLTAFSTSSSGATLPLTMNAIENNAGVSNRITSFTLPLGATINMDGTALYECVAALFIAQAYGVDLSIIQQVIVVITALLASIGAAAIPMAGLVMITVILSAIGLPLEGVGLILAVDRILDMFRTSVNVWSDSCGAVLIAKSEGETLNE